MSSEPVHMLPAGTALPDWIEVHELQLDFTSDIGREDWITLHESEKVRAASLVQHADRLRFVRTRATLRRLLSELLDCAPCGVEIRLDGFGKPYLAASDSRRIGWEFNVSHSGGSALIAISRSGRVGIDIEDRRRVFDEDRMEQQILSSLERSLPVPRSVDFLRRWVAKEAILKCLGQGIARDLRAISILDIDQSRGSPIRFVTEAPCTPPLAALELPSVAPNYAAAVAWTL